MKQHSKMPLQEQATFLPLLQVHERFLSIICSTTSHHCWEVCTICVIRVIPVCTCCRQWTVEQIEHAKKGSVAVLYASAYGNTAGMAQAISRGITKAGIAVETLNLEVDSIDDALDAVKRAKGFIIGSPTLGGHLPTQVSSLGLKLLPVAAHCALLELACSRLVLICRSSFFSHWSLMVHFHLFQKWFVHGAWVRLL